MAPDVVSPLSARVSATLAIAHTFLFTVLKALMPLSVRSVLEMCYAKALYFFSLAYSDFLVYTMSDLSSIVVALPIPLLAVVLAAMRSLLPCYLAGFNLLAFISYFLAAIDSFLSASPIQSCVVGSSAGIRCGTARHNFTITDLASQLIRHLISLIGPFCRCATSALSVIEPFLPAPPMQFCVLGSGAGIRCRPARHRPTVSDLSGQLVRYLIALVGSSYCSITSAPSDIFSGTSGIVACAVLLFCCFAFVFFCSLWMLHSLKTPMDEEELGAGATPTQVDGSIDTDHSIPVNTQPPEINTVDSYLGVSGDGAEAPSSISEFANQAVTLSSAVLDIHPDLTGPRAAQPVGASYVHAGHAIPIREVEDEVDDDAPQFIVSVNPLRASDSPNGWPASESNNRGASQKSQISINAQTSAR
ncbi:hypothetical protein BC629DRAFT_1059474 [Irpex lacteus]|nr:hypothetical protein BC629DRAFT_1059474 [Irpex lacteus]